MSFFTFLRTNIRFLAAGMLLAFLSGFGQTFFISLFGPEIRETFGLSYAQWGISYALATTASAVVMIWAGGLTDRLRARRLGMIVLLGLAGACIFMSLNPLAFLVPLVIFLLRFFGQGMTSHLSSVAMARWFVRSRGRALAIAALGFSIGEAVLPLVFVGLKSLMAWQFLWLVAATILLLSIPILMQLLAAERQPQAMSEAEHSAGMQGRHWTRAQALRTPLFWMVVPLLLGPPAFNTAFFFQQAHIAEVKGWTHLALVALFPIYTAASIAAVLLSGAAVDRFGTARLMALYQLPLGLFFLVFGSVETLIFAAPMIILMGVTSGAQATVPMAFWAEFFGTRYLGSIKATAAALMVFGSALGPAISGWLIDHGVNFPAQMGAIALYIAASSLLVEVAIRKFSTVSTQ